MGLARVRRTRIDQLAEEGSKEALAVQKALASPDNFISACQLGIALATLALGAVGENAFAANTIEWLVEAGVLKGLSLPVEAFIKASFYIFAFSLNAFLITVFGELIPKTATFTRAEQVILSLIHPMDCWCFLTGPFLKILNSTTSIILKLFKVQEPPRHHYVHSEEELKMLVTASHEEGVLQEQEEEMLHSVFDFSDTQVEEVMTPRGDMICISADANVKECSAKAISHGISRIPIYEEDIDRIFGMVHIRDCLRAITENKASSKLREFARPIVIVPENKKIVDLLAEFKKTKTHMAIVVDEYGSTRGLATIEDLLEELVGDIADEYDIVEEYIVENSDGSYVLDARMPLEDVCENLDIDLEDEEFNTIGGHVFGKLGREPQIGDVVEYDDYVFTILESDRHRIIKVKFTRLNNKEETSDTGDAQENLVSAEKEAGKAVESSK